MPTRDRNPRRRVKLVEKNEPESIQILYDLARTATTEDWDSGLRRRFVRLLVRRGEKPELAARIVGAFEKRPELIPGVPPHHVMEKMRELGKIK